MACDATAALSTGFHRYSQDCGAAILYSVGRLFLLQ
jgi:hypothetical protein